jgi:hypothetical protein
MKDGVRGIEEQKYGSKGTFNVKEGEERRWDGQIK